MIIQADPKGNVTIPLEVIKSLGIHPGDRVQIVISEERLTLAPIKETIFDLAGTIPFSQPLDFDQLLSEAQEDVAQEIWNELNDN